jgi:hypothetical protein
MCAASVMLSKASTTASTARADRNVGAGEPPG